MKHISLALPIYALITSLAHANPTTQVIAHRGASDFAPEGTKAAYEIACEIGADFLEIDLQRTKNGALIAFHDDTPERTTNAAQIFPGREKNGIETFTYSELQKLNAGNWFNKKHPSKARASYGHQHILTLDEVIDIADRCPNRVGLHIETKNPERFPAIEKQLAAKLRDRGWYKNDGSVILQTFDMPKPAQEAKGNTSLELLQAEFKGFPIVGLIWLGKGYMENLSDYSKFVQSVANFGATGLGPDHTNLLTPEHVMLIRKEKRIKFVHVYTVDKEEDFASVGEKLSGVPHGIFTNRPDALLKKLGRKHLSAEEAAKKLGY